jgi:hypothetical protein
MSSRPTWATQNKKPKGKVQQGLEERKTESLSSLSFFLSVSFSLPLSLPLPSSFLCQLARHQGCSEDCVTVDLCLQGSPTVEETGCVLAALGGMHGRGGGELGCAVKWRLLPRRPEDCFREGVSSLKSLALLCRNPQKYTTTSKHISYLLHPDTHTDSWRPQLEFCRTRGPRSMLRRAIVPRTGLVT